MIVIVGTLLVVVGELLRGIVQFFGLICDFNLAKVNSEIELLGTIVFVIFFLSVCCILSLRLYLEIDIYVKYNLVQSLFLLDCWDIA